MLQRLYRTSYHNRTHQQFKNSYKIQQLSRVGTLKCFYLRLQGTKILRFRGGLYTCMSLHNYMASLQAFQALHGGRILAFSGLHMSLNDYIAASKALQAFHGSKILDFSGVHMSLDDHIVA